MSKIRRAMRRRATAAACAVLMATSLPLVATAAGASSTHLRAGGSIDEAWMTGAHKGDAIVLLQDGSPVPGETGVADKLGALILRTLTPGTGFSFEDTTTSATSSTFSVLAPGDNPSRNAPLYTGQALHVGLNYVTMRDGIKIAATVRLPAGATSLADGPFPTVMEYSGYGTAGPHDPIKCLILQESTACHDPLQPDQSTVVGGLIARENGFATVSVQMRGSGCSGGAFDLFGYPSDYDGYDMIEVLHHQAWVAHHKVGMVGISYSAISQLEVAGTQPPDLAAITPLSPTDDLFSTGYPGGIYNDGFAAGWIKERIHDAKPALVKADLTPVHPNQAQSWTYAEIAAEARKHGLAHSTCLANQTLHAQSESLSTLVGPGLARDPSLFDRRSPAVWAQSITVPTFLSGALQDEQTGPQWPALIADFPSTTPVYSQMINGGHIDSLDPVTASRWLEFLDLYVAKKVPTPPSFIGELTLGFAAIASSGAPAVPAPALRFTTKHTLAAATAAFASKTPRVRVLFDSGGGSLGAGALQPTYETSASSWPPAGAVTSLYLGSGGTLSETAPTSTSTDAFTPTPEARPTTSLASGNVWAASPGWNWTTVPAADGLAYETPTLTQDETIVGPASLDLNLKSTAAATDLQVTVTEVRPGESKEEYVTSGFLNSSNRTLTSAATDLSPLLTYLAGDKADLPAGEFTEVRIPIDPIAHTFRAGTRLRIVLSAPGGDRPAWTFATPDTGGSVTDTVQLGGATPPRLVVNVVSGVTPAAQPACGALRGEPCRAYAQLGNQIPS